MEERIKKIVDALIQGTKNNKLNWQTTLRDSEFILKLDKGSITVDCWINYAEEEGIEMDIAEICFLNTQGEIIDRTAFIQDIDRLEYRELMNLYNMTKRNSLKIDETIDELFVEIEKKINN